MGIDQSTSSAHFLEQFLEQGFSLRIPESGEFCKGTIVSITDDAVLIDIGAKSEGVLDRREVEQLSPKLQKQFVEGNEITVVVVTPEGRNGEIVLSVERALAESDWLLAEELLASGEPFDCEISGYNKGGLLGRLGSLRAFIPMSHVEPAPSHLETSAYLQEFVGQELPVQVLDVDRTRNRLILTARETMRKLRDQQRQAAFLSIEEGATYTGPIVNIEDFGLFVDLGGVQGLVHLSEVSWQRIDNLHSEFQVGDDIEVFVLQVDSDRERISLSVKRLHADPWEDINQYYRTGQLVEVEITKIVHFGAFARLLGEFELEGLIHISELSDGHIKHPHEVVKPDTQVVARIIRIDTDKRQIGLSLKQVTSNAFKDQDLENLP